MINRKLPRDFHLSSGGSITYPVPKAFPLRTPWNPRRMTTTLRPAPVGGISSAHWGVRDREVARGSDRDVNAFLGSSCQTSRVKHRACQVSTWPESIVLTAGGGNQYRITNYVGLLTGPTNSSHDKLREDSTSTRSPTSRL